MPYSNHNRITKIADRIKSTFKQPAEQAEQRVADLQAQLDAARSEVDAVYGALGDAALAIEENPGPEADQALLTAATRHREAVEKRVQLETALESAQKAAQKRKAAAEAQAQREREARLRVELQDLHQLADSAEKALSKFGEAVGEVLECQRRVAELEPSLGGMIGDANIWLPVIVSNALRRMPQVKPPPVVPRTWSSYMPTPECVQR